MAKHDRGAAMDRLNEATDVHIRIAVAGQFTDRFSIGLQTDNREPALRVWHLRRTDIQKARPVGKFYYIINMSRNADVFVEVSRGLLSGHAWRGFSGK